MFESIYFFLLPKFSMSFTTTKLHLYIYYVENNIDILEAVLFISLLYIYVHLIYRYYTHTPGEGQSVWTSEPHVLHHKHTISRLLPHTQILPDKRALVMFRRNILTSVALHINIQTHHKQLSIIISKLLSHTETG